MVMQLVELMFFLRNPGISEAVALVGNDSNFRPNRGVNLS